WRRHRADVICVGAFRDARRARPRLPPAGGELRCAVLPPGADCRHRSALYRRADPVGAPRDRDTASRTAEGSGGLAVSAAYSWLKALHIVAVIAWMAGLLYLPRL